MKCHDYKSRQVHKTLNGVNPSSGFRDMHSAKSGPNLCQIWEVFGPWASPYWQIVKWPWCCTTTGLENSIELWMEKIHREVTEIWVPQVWQLPVCLRAQAVTIQCCGHSSQDPQTFTLTFSYLKIFPNFSQNSLTFPWLWKIFFFPDRWQPCVHLWLKSLNKESSHLSDL